VHVPYGASPDDVKAAAAAKVNRRESDLIAFRVVRRSLDVRERPRIRWSLAVEFEGEPEWISRLPQNEASLVEGEKPAAVVRGSEPLRARPVVIGAGPAGLFAALALAENGYAPVVVERGRPVEERHGDVQALFESGRLNPESNLLFGEGGAGAYSDGKLTTRARDPRMEAVLKALVACGAPADILVDARPHVGSDSLPAVVACLKRRIESLGGTFRYGFRVTRLLTDARSVEGVASDQESLAAGAVMLAAGASARDLASALVAQGVALAVKPFQVGVRIEHPQVVVDRAVYGRDRGDLPAAEYIMSSPPVGPARGVATFCMCPGGTVVPAVSEPGHLSTNGMSNSRRDGRFANSALVVTVTPDDLPSADALAGLEFQRSLERAAFEIAGGYRAPAQRAADFLKRRLSEALPESSYPLGLVSADLRALLPAFVVEALDRALRTFDRKMPGFIREGVLIGVEARASSPVRILRDDRTRESVSHAGLYPCGEGAGYAGGIMTSAVDGLKSAEALMARWASVPEQAARPVT
jgi:hypothetical protein